MRLPVGGGGGIASHRTGSSRGFAAQLEFVGKQSLHSVLVHHQDDEVNPFRANLEAKASARKAEERRRAPRAIHVAGRNAAPMLSANTKTGLYHFGNHSNALRAAQH